MTVIAVFTLVAAVIVMVLALVDTIWELWHG